MKKSKGIASLNHRKLLKTDLLVQRVTFLKLIRAFKNN